MERIDLGRDQVRYQSGPLQSRQEVAEFPLMGPVVYLLATPYL